MRPDSVATWVQRGWEAWFWVVSGWESEENSLNATHLRYLENNDEIWTQREILGILNLGPSETFNADAPSYCVCLQLFLGPTLCFSTWKQLAGSTRSSAATNTFELFQTQEGALWKVPWIDVHPAQTFEGCYLKQISELYVSILDSFTQSCGKVCPTLKHFTLCQNRTRFVIRNVWKAADANSSAHSKTSGTWRVHNFTRAILGFRSASDRSEIFRTTIQLPQPWQDKSILALFEF